MSFATYLSIPTRRLTRPFVQPELCSSSHTSYGWLAFMHAGIVKFWASAGRGGFGMSSAECASSSIYALATSENTLPIDRTVGWAACTSPIPPKPATIATIKGTNYLPNALAKFHAEEQGMDVVRHSPLRPACMNADIGIPAVCPAVGSPCAHI
eukprot:304062-Chlamydomonas_euryale.AAC.9